MKAFLNAALSLLVTLVFALAVISFIGWSRMPSLFSHRISSALRVPTTIQGMTLSSGSIEITNLTISNPKDSILPKALIAKKIVIDTPWTHYFLRDIVIDSITVDGVTLGLEFQSPKSAEGNWRVMMRNLKGSERHAHLRRHVVIKKLILTNINTDLVYKHKVDHKIQKLQPIDRLEFTNVTGTRGIPSQQILDSVLGQMLQAVFEKENLKNMLENLLEAPYDDVENVFMLPFHIF